MGCERALLPLVLKRMCGGWSETTSGEASEEDGDDDGKECVSNSGMHSQHHLRVSVKYCGQVVDHAFLHEAR